MKIHFLSGLPRSGSTLLAAILRQNPRFHAAMSGPLCGAFDGLLKGMSERNEYAMFLSEAQRQRMARSLFEAYYAETDRDVIFDSNRGWCDKMPALAALFPDAKVIACVRSPAWILDSFERKVHGHPLRRSGMYSADAAANVFTRVDSLLRGGALGSSLQGLRQAWSGEQSGNLLLVRYESLTERPAEVLERLYQWLGEEPFAHDFENLEYDEPGFDQRVGIPGLHTIARRVLPNHRQTILPAEIFSQHDHSFWDVPEQNPRGVTVL